MPKIPANWALGLLVAFTMLNTLSGQLDTLGLAPQAKAVIVVLISMAIAGIGIILRDASSPAQEAINRQLGQVNDQLSRSNEKLGAQNTELHSQLAVHELQARFPGSGSHRVTAIDPSSALPPAESASLWDRDKTQNNGGLKG